MHTWNGIARRLNRPGRNNERGWSVCDLGGIESQFMICGSEWRFGGGGAKGAAMLLLPGRLARRLLVQSAMVATFLVDRLTNAASMQYGSQRPNGGNQGRKQE
jgi:hypothetical protein